MSQPEMKHAYEADKKNWLATDKFSERTPSLFRHEFEGTRGAWLTTKCCLIQNEVNENKYLYIIYFSHYLKLTFLSLQLKPINVN